MRSFRQTSAERGFTLLELLIAMTLLGMLMVVFSGSVRLGTRVWETSKISLDDTSHALVLSGFLKDRIEQATPLVRSTDDAFEPVFEGASDRLRMVSTMPMSLGAQLHLVELAHVADRSATGEDGGLVVRWRRHGRNGDDGYGGSGERTLSSAVVDLRISYFGESADGAPAGWRDDWRNRERLPTLIRFELVFDRDRPDRRLILTAAPKVDEWYDVAF